MWEKCVGCGEGLFAGDAFCGNCGRPVKPAIPAAREPGGLESGPLTAPAADRAQVRIIPARHGDPPGHAAAEQLAAEQAAAEQAAPDQWAREQTAPGHTAPGPAAAGQVTPGQLPPAQDAAGQDAAGQDAAGQLLYGEAPAGLGRPARAHAARNDPQAPGAAPPGDAARTNGTTQQNGASWHDGTGRRVGGRPGSTSPRGGTGRADAAIPGDDTAPRDGAIPGRDAGRPVRPATAGSRTPGPAGRARPMPARLSGLANLDPARNPRYLMYVLRQAAVFTGIYLLIETLLLLGLLLAAAAGTRLGPALRLELDSLWLVALVLAIPFWLIPVPALLAEWSQVMEHSAGATQTAFESINSAFQSHGTPVDSLRVRAVSRHGEGDREYLELRRGHFSGYISCFAHGRDLYVGWTFWLHMSPLRLLMMIIGRNVRDMTSRGDGIRRSLRFESIRALVAAMHGASLAGIDAASSEPGPACRHPSRRPPSP